MGESLYAILGVAEDADREAIRSAVAGNACRCTGYETILDAIESVAEDRD